jgi:hypothetical protein
VIHEPNIRAPVEQAGANRRAGAAPSGGDRLPFQPQPVRATVLRREPHHNQVPEVRHEVASEARPRELVIPLPPVERHVGGEPPIGDFLQGDLLNRSRLSFQRAQPSHGFPVAIAQGDPYDPAVDHLAEVVRLPPPDEIPDELRHETSAPTGIGPHPQLGTLPDAPGARMERADAGACEPRRVLRRARYVSAATSGTLDL